jgi:hypothetical protein
MTSPELRRRNDPYHSPESVEDGHGRHAFLIGGELDVCALHHDSPFAVPLALSMRPRTDPVPGRPASRRAPAGEESRPSPVASQQAGERGALCPSRAEDLKGGVVPVDKLSSGLPQGVSGREAVLLLDTLARLKERRFGRLTVTISDGRVVDIEVTEKIDHELLRNLAV